MMVFSVTLQGLGTAPFLCWNQLELRLKVIRAKCLLQGKRASNIDPYEQIKISIFVYQIIILDLHSV